MSFGGGWFFVAQSEAITVLEQEHQVAGAWAPTWQPQLRKETTRLPSGRSWPCSRSSSLQTNSSGDRSWPGQTSSRWNWSSPDRRLSPGSTPSFAGPTSLIGSKRKSRNLSSDAFVRLKKGLGALDVIPVQPRKLAGRWISRLLVAIFALWLAYQTILGVIAAAERRLQSCQLASIPSSLFSGIINHGASRHDDRSRDFGLDTDWRLDRLQT